MPWLSDALLPHSTSTDQCLGGIWALILRLGRSNAQHTRKHFVYFCIHKATISPAAAHPRSEARSESALGKGAASPLPSLPASADLSPSAWDMFPGALGVLPPLRMYLTPVPPPCVGDEGCLPAIAPAMGANGFPCHPDADCSA